MKVLIVAKTRRGTGACVGGISEEGRSVRLVAADAPANEHAGLEYQVGEVWDINSSPDPGIVAPHVENIRVVQGRRLRMSDKLEATIRRFMPPVTGGVAALFDGLAQATSSGGLYISHRTGLPHRSTMFWVPDQPLHLDFEGKRIRYRYPTRDGGRALTFVGFQEPLAEIPAGTLIRVSLAHWWRPKERTDEELRCFVQLSGWFLDSVLTPPAAPSGTGSSPARSSSGEAPSPGSLFPGRAVEVLKRVFGFSQFLPMQAEVISRVLRHQDALAVMPTGGGKSLCYQLPALLFPGLTVVVSPLVALMHDQVRQLRELNVAAACLNHTVALHDYTTITRDVRQGRVKILYLAPETLLRPETLLLLEQSALDCLAVDEAHCISEWGHDFRPEYRQLQAVRHRFPRAVCLMLTATATERVRADICHLLGISTEGEFVASFNRPNLFLQAERRSDDLAPILAFLEHRRNQSGIIYCGTRKQADAISAALNANGWSTLPYHAGLPDNVRHRNQDRFIRDEVPIMVATVAFGMGINKANVRFVIHAHLPKDLESYYQEIGRAGRDGLPADCLLLHSASDAIVHRRFIDQGAASERPGRQDRLNALVRFAESRECRRKPLLAYFGEPLDDPCGRCDNCQTASTPTQSMDASAAAWALLSCIKETGNRFGPAHLISVLRGSRNKRVLSLGHDRLAAHGAGRQHSLEEWRELVGQFLHQGLVEQNLLFGGLHMTGRGQEILERKETVLVSASPPRVEAVPAPVASHHDPELFERLRALRRELADRAGVPAYVIFSDRALIEMATLLPQNDTQFLAINGVGQIKLANYGDRFLQAIREYCR